MKRKVMFIVLIMIEQLIKCIIYFNFMHNEIVFFDNKIGFKPYINKDQLSIFNNELDLKLNLITLILINIVALVLLFITYKYVKNKEYTNRYFKNSFYLLAIGAVCSIIDKVTLGGSLDYILFLGHIHDLKDIYLYLGVIFIFIYAITFFKYEILKKQV